MQTGGGLAGRQEPPPDRRPLSFGDRDQGLEQSRDLPMMRREFQGSEPCGIMWRTSRRGLAVRRLKFRREDGVAMTEFALILPIFMVIVAGLLGFGRVFFYWIQANHVANETARWAIVDRNPYAPTRRCSSTLREQLDGRVQNDVDGLHRRSRTGATLSLGDPLTVTVAEAVHIRPDPRHRRRSRSGPPRRCGSRTSRTPRRPTRYTAGYADGTCT